MLSRVDVRNVAFTIYAQHTDFYIIRNAQQRHKSYLRYRAILIDLSSDSNPFVGHPFLSGRATCLPFDRATERSTFTFEQAGKKSGGKTSRTESRRATTSNHDDEPQLSPHTGSLRLCISGCVCSTKRPSSPSSSHLNATSDPTNAAAFSAKRARAPFRAQLRPAPSSFRTQDRLLLVLPFFVCFFFFILASSRVSAIGRETCFGRRENSSFRKVIFISFELDSLVQKIYSIALYERESLRKFINIIYLISPMLRILFQKLFVNRRIYLSFI